MSSTDPSTTITSSESGSAEINISLAGKNFSAGDILATLQADIDTGTPLAPVDARFISAGIEYSLSVKGE